MNIKRLGLLRNAARIQRCHNLPTIYRQSIGEHTFGLMSVLITIHPTASQSLWRAMLYHDAPESITGDVPAPAKWRFAALEEALRDVEAYTRDEYELNENLTAFDKRVLKYCDYMELALFAIEECDTGNKNMAYLARNALNAIRKRDLIDVTKAAEALYEHVRKDLRRKQYDGDYGDDTSHGSRCR